MTDSMTMPSLSGGLQHKTSVATDRLHQIMLNRKQSCIVHIKSH